MTSGRETIRAITFTANPAKDNYVCGLAPDEVAETFAPAAGHWGSGAEYLLNTIAASKQAGIHDPHLWDLQEKVAARLEALAAGQSILSIALASPVTSRPSVS